MKTSQNQQILHYLEKNGVISPIEALKYFGCMRLAARVADLRREGHNITSYRVDYKAEDGTSKHYNAYLLKNEEVAG